MPRRSHNLERDIAGAELYVRLIDPVTGASGFVAIGPAVPSSPLRFHRGRPPRFSIPGEAVHTGARGRPSSAGPRSSLGERL
jgi:hypothetical protein